MSLRPHNVAAILLALAVLVGCTPATTQPTTTPSPTYWCTPLPTPGVPQGTPYRCPEHRASSNAQTLALETEAAQVYTRFYEEFARLQFDGGAMEPTSILLETTDGIFHRGVMSILQKQKEEGLVARGQFPTLKIAPERSGKYLDAAVTLTTCEDRTQAALYRSDGTRYSNDGALAVTHVLFKKVDGQLKAFDNVHLDEVAACPFD